LRGIAKAESGPEEAKFSPRGRNLRNWRREGYIFLL